MADLSPSHLPTIPRALVLADIAVQAGEAFVDTDDPAELAQLATSRPWTVTYADVDHPGIITLPDQRVTEADLPLLTALFEELIESDPAPPYDLEALVDGSLRRLAPVNEGDAGDEPMTS
jgi:hypothetical protein